MTAIGGLQASSNGLGLKAVEARLENLLEQASKKEPSYADFFQDLLNCEVGWATHTVSASSAEVVSLTIRQDVRSIRLQLPTLDR